MLGKPGGTVKDLNGHLPDHIRVWVCIHAARHFNAHRLCDLRKYEYVFPTWILDQWRCRERAFYAQNGTTSKDSHPEYIFDSDLLDRLNSLLGQYEGSHSFHNFTVRAEAEGTTVTRDILHCGTCGVIDMQGEQFVRVSIVGRSFMLHQIRKMVGLVIAMARYIAPEFCLKAALAPQNVMAVPVAPEVGLMLVECVYDEYNKQNNHACISLQQFQDEALVFKDKLIYPSIARRTRDLKVFENWLPTVNDNAFKFSTWNRSGGALPNGSSRA
ncbi:unnamed protein product [Ostreobium quekettii]|uniref:tRNA pseudouridine synthase n=1 Tax=Ostreobium quekettii TaxID=121088 RepID=A0A8S1J823_9CHLO|nr:unnamed protein product [Ostreobium quekettii]